MYLYAYVEAEDDAMRYDVVLVSLVGRFVLKRDSYSAIWIE
jgi:hypothetical protein